MHVSGPAVRAAREGRVLIIEGIERAEQNLLPVLNNLLENRYSLKIQLSNQDYLTLHHQAISTQYLREMHLEDGRFLVSPERYDTLVNPSSNLIRTDENFWVIALGECLSWHDLQLFKHLIIITFLLFTLLYIAIM